MYRISPKFILLLLFSVMATSLFSQERRDVAVLYPVFSPAIPHLGKALAEKNSDADSPFSYEMIGNDLLDTPMESYDFLLLVMTQEEPYKPYLEFAKQNPNTSLLLWIKPTSNQGTNSIDGVDGLTSASKRSKAEPFIKGKSLEKAIAMRLARKE